MKIVAEIGNAHEGSLGMALAYIDAVADAGVDAVKFQCHDGDPVSEFRPGTFFPQDATRQDYWQRVGFTWDQWDQLRERVFDHHKLQFGVSVFSVQAVQLVGDLAHFIKIPSGMIDRPMVIDTAMATGKPLVISTGMSTGDELDRLTRTLANHEVCFLACMSEYPTPPEHVRMPDDGLHIPRYNKTTYGISDHSGTIWPSILAKTYGATMAEVHVCFSRQQWGPDVSSSITIDELKQLVQGVRFIEKMQASKLTKDDLAELVKDNRRIFGGA